MNTMNVKKGRVTRMLNNWYFGKHFTEKELIDKERFVLTRTYSEVDIEDMYSERFPEGKASDVYDKAKALQNARYFDTKEAPVKRMDIYKNKDGIEFCLRSFVKNIDEEWNSYQSK